MCKSKSSTDVIEPKTTSSRPSQPSSSRKNSNDPSTSNNFTTVNYTNTGSSYKDSWKSSVSTQTSLSSVRESLPENAHIYEFSEICSATNNFLAKKLTSSTSSNSWRCLIRGNDVVLIQRRFRRPIDKEELRHRLSLVCKSHHTSLIKLRGASASGNYIYLVYDYVHGANLADCLRNPRNPNFTVLWNWMSRVQIATDLAHGLDYVHHCAGLSSNFVHNHIKTSSMIVTEPSLNAKICHFGTAELCGEIESEVSKSSKWKRSDSRVMKFEGTRGYMSPEFKATGAPTQKSDVYAFGVVILELVSGEEPLKYKMDDEGGGYRRVSVVETAREAVDVGVGRLRRWVDKRLKDSYPVEVAERMVRLGLECVEEDPDKRPDMGWVTDRVSKMYLESKTWADKMGVPVDFTVSLAPR
ncbi:lysM domain receptor-like kinase 3 [Actinidia eriantha]|uniref:lysM domain receptor-like kinase 3 n=1 Tax=Actinidia eriantha TaxID=165200 RepID=UPI002589C22C|nr:lysM domain receptor-like kinase 3 [Actinidia eriantha]